MADFLSVKHLAVVKMNTNCDYNLLQVLNCLVNKVFIFIVKIEFATANK